MNKNILIIIIILIIVIVGVVVFLNRGSEGPEAETQLLDQKESFTIEQDLTPVELSPEEQQAAVEQGIEFPAEEDSKAINLQNVRISDELEAIEADLNETDLSGIDLELEAIEADLSGL